MYILDTNILVVAQNGDDTVLSWIGAQTGDLAISAVTAVELEADLRSDGDEAELRGARLDAVLAGVSILAFGEREVSAYSAIIAAQGYSRRKVLDRMIAAQAVVAGAMLVTRNPKDFAAIDGLEIEEI